MLGQATCFKNTIHSSFLSTNHSATQALTLAQQHNLLRQLLALYQEDPVRRRVVLRACGEALEISHKLEDAGVAFVAAGALQEALRAYRWVFNVCCVIACT